MSASRFPTLHHPTTGVEGALARARAHEAAGVDALFFLGGRTREQLQAISRDADYAHRSNQFLS